MAIGIIDAGNSRIKAAIFQGNTLVKNAVFTGFESGVAIFFSNQPVSSVFVGSVIEANTQFLQNVGLNIATYNSNLKLPFTNAYQTPQTLGADRLANAVGAFALNQKKGPVLSIDMGTCIKFDVVDGQSQYLGGSISPGFHMRLKALQHFTQKLPLVEVSELPPLVGNTSVNSIASGVCNGIIGEINSMIDQYEALYPSIKVFLTGGDAPFFQGSLKNNIFAAPLLTLHGLNLIASENGLH